MPHYQPPINLHLFHSRPRLRPQSPIEAFQLFITHEIVDIIVANTNTYADNHRDAATLSDVHSRVWHTTTNPEIWRYFGCLFYMGLELLNTPDDRPVQVPVPYPRWRPLPRPTKCVWCCEHQGSAGPRAKRRKVLAEVMNEANPGTAAYLPQSRAACACHGVVVYFFSSQRLSFLIEKVLLPGLPGQAGLGCTACWEHCVCLHLFLRVQPTMWHAFIPSH